MTQTDTSAAPDSILSAGTPAPDFTLPATPDQTLTLSELRGNPVVLVFYPADWSSVCGDELAVFNQSLPLLSEYHAVLLGISVDSTWSHQAYRQSRKLEFDLLSDYHPKGEVSKLYGSYDEKSGSSKRSLFVIDGDGVISWSYLSPVAINPGVNGVLDALDELKKSAT
ncbi:redoxin domain-containing protein [Gordonia jinhuaensis]|nr:redoxin domain-containing protein [Gordonia jinhuaensis]